MPKKIFTSYSWDNEEHKKWVAKLNNDLRSKYGFEATCDTIRGDGELDTMIVDGITKSDKIIVVIMFCAMHRIKRSYCTNYG